MRTLRLAVTCATLALAGAAGADTFPVFETIRTRGGADTLTVGPVFELKLDLHAGQTIVCETRNLSPGADPVLHMLKPPTVFGGAIERARDDNSGGGANARLRFRTQFPGKFVLLMRATGRTTQGTADLFCDARPVAFALPVGGAFKRLAAIRPNETLTTVPLPKAPTAHVMYVLGSDGKVLERRPSGPNQGVARVLGVRTSETVMLADVWPDITGPMRLVRNDVRLAGHDPDQDGLGSELEKDIGTCSTKIEIAGDFECSRAADLRDTDGDGLRDNLELLGLVTSEPFQLLPRWGADPRHKDLFIEVDSMARSHTDPPHILSPESAQMLAASYADPETDALLRLLHAQVLVNPDRQPGIRLHLDTGVRPADTAPPEEHALYGDWGGHTVVPPICDDDGNCHGANGPSVFRSHMHPNRFGIFHYALGDAANGGQAPVHSVALNMPVANPGTAAHELGHTLGLDHYGPHRDGAVDLNCKPNYPSVMSYAYQNDADATLFNTFADGQGRPTLNNVALRERGAVPAPGSLQGTRYLNDLANVFDLNVDRATGDVDWNRDGVISDTPVRAYANDSRALGGQCEGTRANAMKSQGRTRKALTLTRLGTRTMILSLDRRDGRLFIDSTTDSLACPVVAAQGCGPALARRLVDETWNRSISAMDAHPVSVNGERRLLVVFRSASGVLLETTMGADLSFSRPRLVQGRELSTGDLSLTGNDDHTILAFKNTRGVVVIKVRHSQPGTWDPDEIAHTEDNAEIGILPPGTSPAILEATHADGTRVLYGAFALGPRGVLFIHRQDPATGRWIRNAFSISTEERVLGRPAMIFEPVGAGSPLPGRLRVLFVQRTDDGKKPIRELTLQVAGLGLIQRIRLVARFHDNSDLVGDAVDLLFEPGVDTNVRAAVATALGDDEDEHFIQLRPKADGVVDLVQRNQDDWETLGIELCRTAFLGGSLVRCPGLP